MALKIVHHTRKPPPRRPYKRYDAQTRDWAVYGWNGEPLGSTATAQEANERIEDYRYRVAQLHSGARP